MSNDQILVYFIDEAKEHLQTIERGLMDIEGMLADEESINEVFRAAHSIKGGAAMLTLKGIQHISHKLEDYFKVLKEHRDLPMIRSYKVCFSRGSTNYKTS